MTNRPVEDHQQDTPAVGDAVESDNIVRWDGERLYIEQDVYQNGQLLHRRYRRTVTEPVARALSMLMSKSSQ